jgi:hypothetical protein
MVRRIVSVSFFTAGLVFFAISALAHHGAAAYDGNKTTTVKGRVTDFRFINPHALIYIAVTDESGDVVEWSGELTSPNRLARLERGTTVNWSKTILEPGDEITLSGNPARSGAPSLRLQTVIDRNGIALIGGDN